jgi:hypothetical protein
MNIGQIGQYLGQLGWQHQTMTDAILKAKYQGTFGVTHVLFHVTDMGLRMAINPVLEKPSESAGWSRSVNKLVLALNQESPSIRIGLDKEGDLFVKVDLLKQELNFEQFTYVLMNLCQVSDQLTVPVLQAQAYDTSVALAL